MARHLVQRPRRELCVRSRWQAALGHLRRHDLRYASAATYLPYGPLTSFNFGNGAKRAMTFDSRYRITENKLFNPPTTIARYTYSYDAGENITAIQDLVDATYTRNFGYDDLNRLITANTGTSLWGTGSYAYDAMGNLTSRSLGTPPVDTGEPLSTPGRPFRASTTVTGQVDRLAFTFAGTTPKISIVTANGLDHTISYDAAGNETGYLANRTYSARNLMNAVADTSGEGPAHQISYGYDWRGVRVSRTETPTDAGSASRYFFYSPELQLLESTVDDSNNVWGQSAHHIASAPLATNRDIIWFNGAPVAEIGPPRTPDNTPLSTHRPFATALEATNTLWTFTDHLGTPLIQMDNTTAIVWRAEHEPYGNVWKTRAGARTDQPLQFPGQELAMTWEGGEENYNVFRWYESSFGRYAQADPLGLSAGINLYRYGFGNPSTHTDPTGLFVDPSQALQNLAQQFLNECKSVSTGPDPLLPAGIAVALFFDAKPLGQGSTVLAIPYPKCAKKCKENNCPPCTPPVGTIGYNFHKVPPHEPHPGISGDHVHYLPNAADTEQLWLFLEERAHCHATPTGSLRRTAAFLGSLAMRQTDSHYIDGSEIHIGDRVRFGGHPATVVVVIGRGEYAPGFLADDWTDYERGFLIRTEDRQLYMHDYADEDIEFVARGDVPSSTTG
jgi:RHS repeat-associated protein